MYMLYIMYTMLLYYFTCLYILFRCLCCFLSCIYWLCWVFNACTGFSLAAASRGHSVVVPALLRLLVVEHGLWGRESSVAEAHKLCCSTAHGLFLAQGLNPCPLMGRQILNHWSTREVAVLLY